ncbi:hypothetical protein ACNSPD_16820 [Yersinia enterocolitica]|uniref:hypothetical protein n=1 Tax=Yersinia TaxID=629 RepID=UPI003AB5094B
MKILSIVIVALFSALSPSVMAASGDLAKWQFLGGSMPTLAPAEGADLGIYLTMVNQKTKRLALMDLSGKGVRACKENETSDVEDIAPISIDGEYVKVIKACINGLKLIQPKSDEGKNILNNKVLSGTPVVFDLNDGVILHFPASDIEALNSQINAMQAAK